jgi:formate hydrogenlyase subunit 3/multisubunit Na+/H+ antiporter MnhD subunit
VDVAPRLELDVTSLLVLIGLGIMAASGVPGAFLPREGRAGERLAAFAMTVGCAVGAAGALLSPGSFDRAWAVPGGRFLVHVDGLAAMFLLPVFLVSALGAIYGLGYWAQAEHRANGRQVRLFYGLTTAGIVLLIVAKNGILFLAGWEVMALGAFVLVSTDNEDPDVRRAGFVYLVTTRIGTLAIFGFFAVLHAATGSFDFAVPTGVVVPEATRNVLFALAVFGFGLKAGVMPMHLWLPGAHASAPSHVSALMSGVLIKVGIYGIARFSTLFEDPPLFWGGVLLSLGVVSGVLGVAFAVAQHDIKRLLAYHSVENIGIIVMGLGLGMLGRAVGRADLAALGLSGALLHVWNHALFKSLLFLSAGALVHATGTREIDRYGGLAKSMPHTALAFLIGATAICGLPPLNGFVSEYLLYVGMLHAVATDASRTWLAMAAGVPALALIGALAVACFVKVFGATFLGQARSEDARRGHECGPPMSVPMAILATACAIIGLAPPVVVPSLARALSAWSYDADALEALVPLGKIAAIACAVAAASALGLASLRRRALRSATAVTWDCGYAAPRASMQYTASSFAQMLVDFFGWALRPRRHATRLASPFAEPSSFHSDVPDVVLDRLVIPFARRSALALNWFRWMQRGSLHAYLVFIMIALLVALFVWR